MSVRRIICLLILSCPSVVISGDHVCPRVENYTVTSIERYTEPIVVNTFTWCLQIPPRCPKTRTEMRQKCRVKAEVKTRIVNECCDGYRMIEAGENTDCVPFCENCLMGACVAPNRCQCDPGYEGDDCASACPAGTWGSQCKQKCECEEDAQCHPVTGECFTCPSGSRVQACNKTCPEDRWGSKCTHACVCENTSSICRPGTVRCFDNHVALEDASSVDRPNSVEKNDGASFTEAGTTRKDPSGVSETGARPAEEAETYVTSAGSDYPSAATSPETSPDHPRIRTQTRESQPTSSSTVKPVIVLVSIPERRRNMDADSTKFVIKNPYLRHVDAAADPHGSSLLKTDYVKTIHKDDVQPSSIPLDIALIVVASIVSLGLTSIAVVMVLHMRSKLFETVRLSIYDDEKTKNQERGTISSNTGTISTITTPVPRLPEPRVRTSNVYCPNLELPGTPIIDGNDPLNNYANGAATIGYNRVSANLRDLLQDGHYDMPPTSLIRLQTETENNTEHVYDEIPLQPTPSYGRKYS